MSPHPTPHEQGIGRTNIPKDPTDSYRLPENVSDANEDGRMDEQDFIRAFSNLEMNNWEIGQIF